MSTFDIRQDAPGLLRSEAQTITIKFDRTGTTTGRISWNIPTPAAGCDAETQAYCGMVVTLDTKPASSDKLPVNETVYNSDPSADINLHAGDKIGTSLVVGAFYNDRTTTFFDITGLKSNTPYYVSGFPSDCQFRYFVQGVHAYSQDSVSAGSGNGTDSTNGSQVLVLNSTSTPMGAQPTDSTGLLPGVEYNFNIQLGITPNIQGTLDSVDCKLAAPQYTITIDGANGTTVEDLVGSINAQLATLDNPAQGDFAPNTNGLYWNSSSKSLFTWDGSTHQKIENVIIQATQPNVVVTGTYWLNPTTNVLSFWTGTFWITVTVLKLATDPTQPICDSSVWFNGTSAYTWNGTVWCESSLTSSTVDPSIAVSSPCGSYWNDTKNEALFKWNDTLDMWQASDAIQYHEDPRALSVGTYWFNQTIVKLFKKDTPAAGWNLQTTAHINENPPTTPGPGRLWYKPTTQQLFERNLTNTEWVEQEVLVFPSDPTDTQSCELWWNTDTNILNVWDTLSSTWKPISVFFQQAIDPSLPPVFVDGNLWFNPTDNLLYSWANSCFKPISYVSWPVDPTTGIGPGTVWFDGTTWFNRSTTQTWVAIPSIVTSLTDPHVLAVGTYWFNTSNNTLQVWNGIAWVALTYSPQPYTPKKGTKWFDTTTHTLKQWDGTQWIPATPPATVELDCNGNLLFTDTGKVGGLSFVGLTDGTLFKSLTQPNSIHSPKPGTDGVSSQPSYAEQGIGTNGSAAERTKFATEIRYQLGYPTVDVELTTDQLDYALTRALEELRSKSSVAYNHGFFFMRVSAETQKYFLTNKIQGMHKIVNVLGVHRMTSSFLSSAHGAGVYGQIVMQHLYNMGTFDLLSFHLMAEYTELMEMLFAGRITFTFNETTRELFLHHRFPFSERMVLIEANTERTEQEIMLDRWCRPWILKYATSIARDILAEVRGKYSTLPGAGGSISLNASDLRLKAQEGFAECQQDLDDYVVDRPEQFGMGTQFLMG